MWAFANSKSYCSLQSIYFFQVLKIIKPFIFFIVMINQLIYLLFIHSFIYINLTNNINHLIKTTDKKKIKDKFVRHFQLTVLSFLSISHRLGEKFKFVLCRHCLPNRVVLWNFCCRLPHQRASVRKLTLPVYFGN